MQLSGQHIHFMGIGGIGVSALAEMALAAGASVSGCDRAASDITSRLAAKGIKVHIGHDPEHIKDCDLLVYSSALPPSHPERMAAGDRQEKRGQFLAHLMDKHQSIGIAGTHGKTSTTWLTSRILIQAKLDPNVFVGGIVPELPEGNYRLGSGVFVAELDESDASFLLPCLDIAVITNIESDHLGYYQNDSALFEAFRNYAAGVANDGLLIAGVDSQAAADVFQQHQGRKISFGFNPEANVQARIICSNALESIFNVTHSGNSLGEFSLSMPGRHNIENALAAIATAIEMQVEPDIIRTALASANGVKRRLEKLGRQSDAILYSDYAHHPTEIVAAIEGLRQRHSGKILVIFQPHLFSRTRDYAEAFGKALAQADATLLIDIYPAREKAIPGVTSELLAEEIRKHSGLAHAPVPLCDMARKAAELIDGYEAVVFMGAGDIDDVARIFATEVLVKPNQYLPKTP